MSSPPVQIAPAGITPPPALGPPIIGTDPGSVAGIAQPVFASGSATSPATPIPITGTPILPPPQVGMDGTVTGPAIPVTTVPPSIAGVTQPQYATGSGTAPTAASLFPAFTAAGPSPPIVVNTAQNVVTAPSPPAAPPVWVAPPALPLPTTPGIAPIVLNGWGLYAGPAPATPWPFAAIGPMIEAAPVEEEEETDLPRKTVTKPPPKASNKSKPHGHHRH